MNKFTKNLISYGLIISIAFSFFSSNVKALNFLSHSEAYASLVKVNLFSLNNQGFLEKISSDAGVIISSDGLVLTNYQDQERKDFIYQICLNTDQKTKFECAYIGKIVAINKEKNLSLLRIENISGLSFRQDFPYLKLSNLVNEEGSDLSVLFYQNINSKETFASLNTKIYERINNYNLNWLKTRESFSFRDSLKFKIAIDKNGKLIAINNETYFDKTENDNYLLEINSIEQWIRNNEFKNAQNNHLDYKLIDFIKKDIDLSSKETFSLSYPKFYINRPESFDFAYISEDNLKMYNKVDNNSGFINISLLKFPYKITNDDFDWIFKFDKLENLENLKIIQIEDIKIDKKIGKRINFSISGENKKAYYIPHEEFVIKIDYDYGNSSKDKTKIDKSINSLIFENYASNPEYTEIAKINNHKLNIKNLIKEREENIQKITDTKTIAKSEIIIKQDPAIRLREELKKQEELKSKNIVFVKLQNFLARNKALYNKLKGKIILKTEDFGKTYYISPNNNTIHYLGSAQDAWKIMNEEKIGIKNRDLYKISIGVIDNKDSFDSDNDGLSDILEKTLGLNPDDKDTDKDGYNDKLEIDNDYSPWKFGKQDIDYQFANNQKGKIFSQVEKNGELWYVNPLDQKRYLIAGPNDALALIKKLSLGISNKNFEKLTK